MEINLKRRKALLLAAVWISPDRQPARLFPLNLSLKTERFMADVNSIIENNGTVTLCGVALDRAFALRLVDGDETAADQLQAAARSIVCCDPE
jgi:hypothetical protein